MKAGIERSLRSGICLLAAVIISPAAIADENLFGYVKGAEPLPKGATELYGRLTQRSDKGTGHYEAWDLSTEVEYGLTDKLAISGEFQMMAIDTHDILIDAYVPGDEKYGFRPSGVETALKYNFLSPAAHSVGVSLYNSFLYSWRDPHSGQDKDTLSFEEMLLLQKYFLDGQLIWTGNGGIEATYANRKTIDDLPEGFEWPTTPEMEIELTAATGLSYRFLPSWFVGVEAFYQEEHETEVGLERWSFQAGPNLHYGSSRFWVTATWLPQIRGGGPQYAGQQDENLHLIEKTKQEYRLKVGYNF
jgi:hypothetical protein